MTNFDEREKGFEAKFFHDQNIEFKSAEMVFPSLADFVLALEN